jgi:hypothetical protein
VTACNTARGAGEDISNAGQTIQNNVPDPKALLAEQAYV